MECDEASGRRVLPCAPPRPPLRAWHADDKSGNPNSRSAAADDVRLLLDSPGSPPSPLPEKKIVHQSSPSWKERVLDALRPPYFVMTMIIFLAVMHWAGGSAACRALEWAPGAWRREPWRLVSYAAVHASAAHVALNSLVALAVAWRLEREQGAVRVAAVWAGGVLAGALGAGALQPHVRVVGASAAVYALLTAHLPNVCLRFGHVPLWWFRPLSVVVLSASEGCWALVRSGSAAAEGRVAWAAHIVGALAGIPLGFLLFSGERADSIVMRACRLTSGAVLTMALMAAIVHFAWCLPER